MPTRGLYGRITHTELVSSDPAATKAWCAADARAAFETALSEGAVEMLPPR